MFSNFFNFPIIAVIAVIFIGSAVFIVNYTKNTRISKETKEPTYDLSVLDNLYHALGTATNIASVERVQQRIQVEIKNVWSIDHDSLKKLNFPTFITGKKITLLVKDQTQQVVDYLNDKRKEDV